VRLKLDRIGPSIGNGIYEGVSEPNASVMGLCNFADDQTA
jgi:hypothetical protein